MRGLGETAEEFLVDSRWPGRNSNFDTVKLEHLCHSARLMPTNVLGTELQACCFDPLTGFYRDGYCRTGPGDIGLHTVCAEMTAEFLEFSKARGNDLITPRPEFDFPGLKPGDRWCVCVRRWTEALDAGVAPKICLEATHASAIEFASLEDLEAHAVR